MVIWSKHLYLDEKIAKEPEKYKKMTDGKHLVHSCFLIVLSNNPVDSLEIFSTREYWFQYRRRQELKVVGIASCRDSAFALVEKIVAEVYKQQGDVSRKCIFDFLDDAGW